MLNYKIKIIESFVRPFYNSLNFWPFSIKFIRHPIYKQIQYNYNKYCSRFYNFEQIIETKTGFRIFCRGDKGSIEMDLVMSRDYEPEISQYILDNINNTEYFLDIGANIGFYSLLISKINPDIKIISFEPVKETFSRFVKNIEENQFTNITPHNIGLANENKKSEIFLDKELGHNSLLKKDGKRETITINRLDDFLVLKGKKIFIKIDTEGYEFESLKGMINLLRDNDCQIIFEFTPKFYIELYKDQNAPKVFLDFLKEKGFKIISVDPKSLKGGEFLSHDQSVLFVRR